MLKKTHECFTVSIEDNVAHITMNRPQAMNAMNKAFWNELPKIVREIDRDALARVIVISSTGKSLIRIFLNPLNIDRRRFFC